MKKLIFAIICILSVSISGCQSLDFRNPFAVPQAEQSLSAPSAGQTNTPSPYLVRGSTAAGKTAREKPAEENSGDFSIESLAKKVRELEDNYEAEKGKRAEAEKNLKNIQLDYGKRCFDLENKLMDSEKQAGDYKSKITDAGMKMLKAEQELNSLKLEIQRKKEEFESYYPSYYEVRKGDSLWKIAAKENIYKNPYKWIEIFAANKDKVSSPKNIYPGQVLKIPRYFEYQTLYESKAQAEEPPEKEPEQIQEEKKKEETVKENTTDAAGEKKESPDSR
jgi:nucleoid-associated protein YgaU